MIPTQVNVLYIGLHPDTPEWINRSPFRVIAVSNIDILTKWRVNPLDILFVLILRLHKYGVFPRINRVLLKIWVHFSKYSSSIFERYKNWIVFIVESGARVFDVDDNENLSRFIDGNRIDLGVVNCWSILHKDVLDRPAYGFINIHPSKLPLYRGAVPTLWALRKGENELAVTFFKIDSGVDTGGLLAQYIFDVPHTRDAIEVEGRVDSIIRNFLYNDLVRYVRGDLKLNPQVGLGSGTPKYESYRKIQCWEECLQDIINKVELYPYLEPGLFCYVDVCGHPIHIRSVQKIVNQEHPETPSGYEGCARVTMSSLLLFVRDGVLRAYLFRDVNLRESILLLFLLLMRRVPSCYN